MKRHLLVVVCLALTAVLASCRSVPVHEAHSSPLAVLGAFKPEVVLLEKMLADANVREIEGIAFMSGRLGDKPVVIVWTGVGKVNAAMTTTLLIEHFKPVWNTVVDGFGNHDPGAGRINMRRPKWDIVHPGRPWAERLSAAETPEQVVRLIESSTRTA